MIKKTRLKRRINQPIFKVIVLVMGIVSLVTIGFYFFNQTRIEKKPPIILLGNDNLAPIVYNDNNKVKGVAVDLAYAIGEAIDRDIIVKTMNWDKAQQQVLDGEADGLLHMNLAAEREQLFSFSEELLISEFSIFIRKDNQYVNSIKDLSGQTVGVEMSSYPYHLLQQYENINIESIESWHTAFNRLSDGQIEALLIDRWIGEYELAKSQVAGIKVLDTPVSKGYSTIAVRKGNDGLLSEVNEGIQSIKDSGELTSVLSAWSGERVVYLTESRLNTYLLIGVITLLSVVIIAIVVVVLKLRHANLYLEQEVKKRTKELEQKNTQLQELNEELEEISLVDKLTMIPNRRRFDMEIEKTWSIKKQEKRWLSIIMIDIDYFNVITKEVPHFLRSVKWGMNVVWR